MQGRRWRRLSGPKHVSRCCLRSPGRLERSYQCDEEDGHVHADHDCEELERFRIKFGIDFLLVVDLVVCFAQLLVDRVSGRHCKSVVQLSFW